jgi:acetolactate synthase-1/3 small subunit
MEKFTVELIVSNHYGVLNRITGLYARRGYNIDSLYVNETENPELSRMMIVSKGDEYIQTQMVRQLSKLYDVKEVTLMTKTKR